MAQAKIFITLRILQLISPFELSPQVLLSFGFLTH